MSKLNVGVCIPGNPRSLGMEQDLMELMFHLFRKCESVHIHRANDAIISRARDKCLWVKKDSKYKFTPWGGKLPYTHMLWIDTDTRFKPWMFDRLVKLDMDCVGGAGLTEDRKNLACGKLMPEAGGSVAVCSVSGEDPIDMAYLGFGFLLFKQGVFEKIERPWFDQLYMSGRLPESVPPEQAGEDVSFFLRAQHEGIFPYVDPIITNGYDDIKGLGHEKPNTLYAQDMTTISFEDAVILGSRYAFDWEAQDWETKKKNMFDENKTFEKYVEKMKDTIHA